MSESGQSFWEKVLHELKDFGLISIYLWVVLELFLFYKSVLQPQNPPTLADHGFALVNALALGKIILLGKLLPFYKRMRTVPLIYPTLTKSAVFALLLAVFKILEEAGTGFYHGESFQQSITMGGGNLKGIFTVTVMMFVMLTPFFAVCELQDALGEGRLAREFFHARSGPELPK